MTSTSSVAQQALLLQLLQQEQLQQAAAAKADATTQATNAATTAATAASIPSSSLNSAQATQVGAAFSSALSQLGSKAATPHVGGPHGHKVDQVNQSYSEQGPSNETETAPIESAA